MRRSVGDRGQGQGEAKRHCCDGTPVPNQQVRPPAENGGDGQRQEGGGHRGILRAGGATVLLFVRFSLEWMVSGVKHVVSGVEPHENSYDTTSKKPIVSKTCCVLLFCVLGYVYLVLGMRLRWSPAMFCSVSSAACLSCCIEMHLGIGRIIHSQREQAGLLRHHFLRSVCQIEILRPEVVQNRWRSVPGESKRLEFYDKK